MSGRLITIYSSKGGVGKSFIAANLAVDIHLETKQKVVLIDFARPFSIDIARLLNLSEIKKVDTILATAKNLNPGLLKSFVTPHPSGIALLSLTDGAKPGALEAVTPENVAAFLSKLMASYDYLIVDMGTKFDAVVEKVFDLSAFLILPVAPDFLSVQQTRSDLRMLQTLNFPQSMIALVGSMTGNQRGVTTELLEQQVGRTIAVTVPWDGDALAKLTEGTYPLKFPRHPVTKALDQLSYQVIHHARSADAAANGTAAAVAEGTKDALTPELDEFKYLIHEKLLESIDFKRLDTAVEDDPEKMAELRMEVTAKITEIIDDESTISSRSVRDRLLKEVLQESLGLGPLEDLLADPSVSEIMVNTFDEIFVEQKGRIQQVKQKFLSHQHLMNIIGRIVAPLGRKIDTSSPMVDARLKDGSRVNAIIPPLALKGACLTIRKFPEDRMRIDDLLSFGSLNKQIAEFVKAAVLSRLNILVSGGTGTGKTTLLNILSGFIPADERIITIEDSAELQLQQPHVVTLESRPPNIEGKGEILIRDLVKNALRMRPDRIVVGECRGAEALDMLQAMNTGHDGSLTTIHANSAREALSRLETLVMYAGFELPSKAIKEQILGAIDLVVQIKRFKDGTRKVVQVTELTGMEGTVITLGDVFVFNISGEKGGETQGSFVSTGYVPKCLDRFKERGISIPREIFWTAT